MQKNGKRAKIVVIPKIFYRFMIENKFYMKEVVILFAKLIIFLVSILGIFFLWLTVTECAPVVIAFLILEFV